MTSELKDILQQWLDHKYGTRIYYSKEDHKNIKLTPTSDNSDLVFSTSFVYDKNTKNMYLKTNTPTMSKTGIKRDNIVYISLAVQFDKVLDQLKIGYEDLAKRRRKITFHSFRRAYKTIISNLGYSDYSEWALNHSGSPYYRAPEQEKYKIFRKIESAITFLDQSLLERKGADMSNRIEIVEQENRELKANINKIMGIIQENPKLANVKPEVLTKKI
jgi:hypothetical protein